MRAARGRAIATGILGSLLIVGAVAVLAARDGPPVRSVAEQYCGLDPSVRTLVERGTVAGRSGDIVLVPSEAVYIVPEDDRRRPTGPWASYQRIPLIFYGPGTIEERGELDAPATLADVTPTIATLLGGVLDAEGSPLADVGTLQEAIEREPPKVVVTVVWQGAGWDLLGSWPGDQESLLTVIEEGTAYEAAVGSSPSDPAAALTTLSTGSYPAAHGITGDVLRGDDGTLIGPGPGAPTPDTPSLATRWIEQTDGRARVAVVGPPEATTALAPIRAEEGPAGVLSIVREGELWATAEGLPAPDPAAEEPDVVEQLLRREGFGSDDVTDLIYIVQDDVDRAAGASGDPGSEAVFEALEHQDRVLGELVELLERRFEDGRYVLVVTADGGTPPVHGVVAVEAARLQMRLEERFGSVVAEMRSTEVFLDAGAGGANADDIAAFLATLRVRDAVDVGRAAAGDELLFRAAVPSGSIGQITC